MVLSLGVSTRQPKGMRSPASSLSSRLAAHLAAQSKSRSRSRATCKSFRSTYPPGVATVFE
eukprot:5233871-Pyramimonas_sp.AAC.1